MLNAHCVRLGFHHGFTGPLAIFKPQHKHRVRFIVNDNDCIFLFPVDFFIILIFLDEFLYSLNHYVNLVMKLMRDNGIERVSSAILGVSFSL